MPESNVFAATTSGLSARLPGFLREVQKGVGRLLRRAEEDLRLAVGVPPSASTRRTYGEPPKPRAELEDRRYGTTIVRSFETGLVDAHTLAARTRTKYVPGGATTEILVAPPTGAVRTFDNPGAVPASMM